MPYISLKTETMFVLLWLYRVSVRQENSFGKSLAPAARKALAGTSSPHRAVWGAMCPVRETDPAVCQYCKKGLIWTPGAQLDTGLFVAGVGCVCP